MRTNIHYAFTKSSQIHPKLTNWFRYFMVYRQYFRHITTGSNFFERKFSQDFSYKIINNESL